MGWKPGQGVGPRLSRKDKSKIKQQNDKRKVYGCPLPQEQTERMTTDSADSDDEDSSITFAPDDYEPFRYGINFKIIVPFLTSEMALTYS